jgi:hypothetical protein
VVSQETSETIDRFFRSGHRSEKRNAAICSHFVITVQ